jgi:hypothetical protein
MAAPLVLAVVTAGTCANARANLQQRSQCHAGHCIQSRFPAPYVVHRSEQRSHHKKYNPTDWPQAMLGETAVRQGRERVPGAQHTQHGVGHVASGAAEGNGAHGGRQPACPLLRHPLDELHHPLRPALHICPPHPRQSLSLGIAPCYINSCAA